MLFRQLEGHLSYLGANNNIAGPVIKRAYTKDMPKSPIIPKTNPLPTAATERARIKTFSYTQAERMKREAWSQFVPATELPRAEESYRGDSGW
jgi:hypothetical protein